MDPTTDLALIIACVCCAPLALLLWFAVIPDLLDDIFGRRT